MNSLYVYPEYQVWEIIDSSVSGLDLVAMEVCIGMSDVFSRLFFSTMELKTRIQKSASFKESSLNKALAIAVEEIRGYQTLEDRTEDELLLNAAIVKIDVEKDVINLTIDVEVQSGASFQAPLAIGV